MHGHGVEQVEQDRVEVQVGRAIGLEMDEGVRRLAGALGAFLEPDGAATEDGEPDEGDDRGDEHDPGDELPDGAAARDAGDEHSHEGCPGDPPGPVEDRPGGQPLGHVLIAHGRGARGHGGQLVDEVADRRGDDVEDEQGGSADEDDDRQQHSQHHVDVRQPLDALLNAGDRGGHEAGRQDRDDADHHRGGGLGDEVGRHHAPADLQGSQPQGAGRPEQGGDDRQDVDDAPADPVDGLAPEQGGEHGREELGASQAVGPVCHPEPHQGVHRPRVDGPVEHGRAQGGTGGLGGLRVDRFRRGRHVEVERLTDPIKNQSDTHSRGEHHGDPGAGGVLGLLSVPTQGDLAEPGGRHEDDEDDEQGRGQDEQPAEVADRSPQGPLGGPPQTVRRDEAPHDEGDGRGRGDAEDHLVHSLTDVVGLAGDRSPQAVEQVTLAAFHGCRGGLEGRRRGRRALEDLPCPPFLRAGVPLLLLRQRWRVEILVTHQITS